MIHRARHLLRRRAPRRAFTLIEVLLVAVLLAIMAALVTPTLTNASAPLPDSIRTLLEIDMRRTGAEAVARMQRTVLVVNSERSGWWIAMEASPEVEIAGTRRVLGRGNLLPFEGYRLAIELNGAAAPDGNIMVVTLDALGGRDTATVRIGVIAPTETVPEVLWTLEPQRLKFSDEAA